LKIFLGAVLIVLVALLGSRRTFTRVKLPLAARHIYLTGTEYILVGLCLGSQMLGLLDAEALKGLAPLLYLSLGWIGLLFGIQLEVRQMRIFPTQYYLLAALQALFTMIFCFVPFLFFLGATGESSLFMSIAGALALAAMAVPTGQSSLALVHKELKLRRNRVTEALGYVAGVDASFGLIVIGFVFCFVRTLEGGGSVLHFLTRLRCTQEELLLFTVGAVTFGAGAASYLGISPLFVTAVSGLVLANTQSAKVRILRALATLEKPFYIIVLLLGGAMLQLGGTVSVVLGMSAMYILLRLGGKVAGGYVASVALTSPAKLPASIGLGLLSQGGMSAAMVVSFYYSNGGEMAGTILTMVLVALVVNELLSPFFAEIIMSKAS
jgi:Kef-type K+ transport system membrane component KefB